MGSQLKLGTRTNGDPGQRGAKFLQIIDDVTIDSMYIVC
jgi:hypothetical protein